jgi:hypothetical protein
LTTLITQRHSQGTQNGDGAYAVADIGEKMKRKIKAFGFALVALCAIGVVSASAAFAVEDAPRWTVAGAFLGSGVEEPFTGTSSGSVNLAVPALGVTLTSTTCTTEGKIVGSAAEKPGTNKGVFLTCTGVTVTGGANCEVHSAGQANGTIKTNELDSILRWKEQTPSIAALDTLTPTSGANFVGITFVSKPGVTCALAGTTLQVTGNVLGAFTPVGEDVTEGTLTFPTPAIKKYFTNQTPSRTEDEDSGLLLGSNPATFSGVFKLKLTSGKTVGIKAG